MTNEVGDTTMFRRDHILDVSYSNVYKEIVSLFYRRDICSVITARNKTEHGITRHTLGDYFQSRLEMVLKVDNHCVKYRNFI